MSVLTDTGYILQQIRLASLNSDGAIAERVIQMPTLDGMEENSFYELSFEPTVGDADGFLASNPRPSKAKRFSKLIDPDEPVQKNENPNIPIKEQPKEEPKEIVFTKIPHEVQKVKGSALTAIIKQKSTTGNPYMSYSTWSGKGEAKPVSLKIFLPFCDNKKPMQVIVKRDASVEDVIGYALYQYMDEGRAPAPLGELGAYSLRIVEDDGDIDDDFPALERGRKIEKFSFDRFALCEQDRAKFLAAINAKKQAEQKDTKKKASQVFLKIHLYSTLEIKHTTSISALSDEKLGDLLARLCKKHTLDQEDYTLRLADTKTDAPLDKTVGEANISALCLMKKARISAGDIFVRPAGEQMSDTILETRYSTMAMTEFSAFKKYNVQRRTFGAKKEKTIAVDGENIHIMPPETSSKTIFDSNKITSFARTDILSCELKGDNIVRISFRKGKEEKMHEYEMKSTQETDDFIHRLNFAAKKK